MLQDKIVVCTIIFLFKFIMFSSNQLKIGKRQFAVAGYTLHTAKQDVLHSEAQYNV